MDQIEVFPSKDGSWNWRRRLNDRTAKTGPGFDTRTEALTAARAANGVETVTLTRADGSSAGTAQVGQGEYRVVLLRLDGSMVGELDHVGNQAGAQHINLTPATENGDAGPKEEN